MATKKTRTKAQAVYSPQSRAEVIDDIRRIGVCQRERQRIEAAMNDELAKVRERYEAEAHPHAQDIAVLSLGVQTWCEANRVELTFEGKTKTVQFSSGEVKWRMRPPSVTVRNAEAVIEALKEMGLGRFVRTKEEVNKEAVLAEPLAVGGVRGIKITQGEDFVIEPFKTELEKAAA